MAVFGIFFLTVSVIFRTFALSIRRRKITPQHASKILQVHEEVWKHEGYFEPKIEERRYIEHLNKH